MVQNVNAARPELALSQKLLQSRSATQEKTVRTTRTDTVSFSATVSKSQAQNILLDRAYEQLRGVVAEARTALGIPEGETVDISSEATADRIADFALNFFSQYAKNNGLGNDEEGRRQFAEFIGGAIGKGIDEARGILTALNALNPENGAGIDKTAELIQARLDDFIANGLV